MHYRGLPRTPNDTHYSDDHSISAFTSVSAGTGKTTQNRRLCAEGGVALDKGATFLSPSEKVVKDGLASGLGGLGSPSLDNQKTQPFKRPTSRRKKWYRRWQRIKKSYLSYFNYIHLRPTFDETTLESSNSSPSRWLDSALIHNLEDSGKYWYKEQRSILPPSTDSPLCRNLTSENLSSFDPLREVEGAYEYRMRLKGCGDRVMAPIEGTYYCDSLANDAIALAKGIVNALGMEEKLQCFGDKWVFTLPKELSAELDAIRGTDKWRKKINKLFNAAANIIKKQHPEGEVSMTASLQLSGEERPWEANYHFNFYVLPVVRDEGKWKPLERWIDQKELDGARNLWKKKVQKIFGVELDESDIWRGYLKDWSGRRGADHFIRYLFRHPLEDLWKGWQGFDCENDELTYSYRKYHKHDRDYDVITLVVSGEEALEAFNRVEDLPHSFKRIRWYGYLGGSQRGDVLRGLGFEAKEAKSLATWTKVHLYEVKGFGYKSWKFKEVNPYGKSDGVISVPVSKICYCPDDTIGGRRVWIPPPNLGALTSYVLGNGAKIVRGRGKVVH